MRPCLLGVAILAACSRPPATVVPAPAPAPAPAPPAPPAPDRGAFVFTEGGEPTGRETFSLQQVGDHQVLRTQVIALSPMRDTLEGELETDAQGAPIRAAFQRQIANSTYTYRLGGAPLVLEITQNNDPQRTEREVADGPIATYVVGPETATLTPLCKVTGEVALPTLGGVLDFWRYQVEAYRAAPLGALRRVVVLRGAEMELVCEGERLIAGGTRAHDTWFVRDGHAPALAALQAAGPLPPHAWKHPAVAREPWHPSSTYLVDGMIVIHDARTWVDRLTAVDVGTGAQLAQRDLPTGFDQAMQCAPMTGGRLACVHRATRMLQVLDAATLTMVAELGPVLLAAMPTAADAEFWRLANILGDLLYVAVDDVGLNRVRIDVGRRTAQVATYPEAWNPRGIADPAACRQVSALTFGRARLEVSRSASGLVLEHTVGKAQRRQPLPAAYADPSLFECPTGGPYVINQDAARSALVRITPEGTTLWTTPLGGAPFVRASGPHLLVVLDDGPQRVMALDAATGRITWSVARRLPSR